MDGNRGRNEAAVENGNLLQLGECREIAIYRRDGVAWVAVCAAQCPIPSSRSPRT